MIEASMSINDGMAEYVMERANKILNRSMKPMNGSKILILGVAYKQDIDDYRESPAIRVIDELEAQLADVVYYDPHIAEYTENGVTKHGEPELTVELIESADLVIVTTAHSAVDYDMVQKHAQAIFDTKNAMKAVETRDNIELL